MKKKKKSTNRSRIGRQARISGHEFEKKVAELLELQGYEIELNVEREGTEQDIIARLGEGTFFARKKGDIRVVVQCKKTASRIGKTDIKDFNVNITHARLKDECDRGLIVSESGFVKTTQELRNEFSYLEYKTYDELLSEAIDFSSYLKKLIANFDESPENAPDDPPLLKCYIPLKAEIKPTENIQGQLFEDIADFVGPWLARSNHEEPHIVILGTYGTGKTTFCKKFVRDMADDFLNAESRIGLRIPILFYLSHFTKKMEIESLVTRHLDKECRIGARYDLFARMNKAGLLFLVFDGFDEMATKVTWDVIQTNIMEINKLAAHSRSKILLTSRPEHFISEEEEIASLESCGERLMIQHRQFQRVNILPLDSNQVNNYLKKRVSYFRNSNKKWTYYRDKINEIHNLTDLSTRPVLLEMIVRTLPTLVKRHEEDGIEINRSNLYQRYLEGELDRQEIIKRREQLVDRGIRFDILRKLAIRFYLGETTTIAFDDAAELISETINVPKRELESHTRDFLTCSFLVRAGNDYRFSHNSLWEYLIAHTFSNEIRSYRKGILSSFKSFGRRSITPIICDFLAEMAPNENKLWNIILETRKKLPSKLKYIGSNACSLLNSMNADFRKLNLSNTYLEFTNLNSCDLSYTNMSCAILKNANLSNTMLKCTDFSYSDLNGARFEEMAEVTSVEWSPNGDLIASGGMDSYVRIWDAKVFREVGCVKGLDTPVNNISWSPNSKRLAFGHNNKGFLVYDITMRKICHTMNAKRVLGPIYWEKGDYLVLENGVIKIVSSVSKKDKTITRISHYNAGLMAATPKSKVIAFGIYQSEKNLLLVDISSNKRTYISGAPPHLCGLHMTSRGRYLIRTCCQIKLRNLKESAEYMIENAHPLGEGCYSAIYAIASTMDENILATGCTGGSIKIWSLPDLKELIEMNLKNAQINALSFSPDGKYLATGDIDKTIKIWNTDPNSKTFGTCLRTIKQEINCGGANFIGAKGLDQKALKFFKKRKAITEIYTVRQLRKETIRSLQDICENRGLKKDGKKSEIIDRILNHQELIMPK